MKLLFSFFALIALNLYSTPKKVNIVPGGQNVGIELKAGGIIVTGTYDIKYDGKTYNPKTDSDINVGDIIYKVDGQIIKTIDSFIEEFKDLKEEENNVVLQLKRKGKHLIRTLKIIKIGDRYKTGLFVKERVLGVGTISFYDEKTKMYGALGHEISDTSTNDIFEVDSGLIYDSKVTSIVKSQDGKPGEKVADIEFDSPLGNIATNTPIGIYGQYEVLPKNVSSMPLAEIDEVELGKAEIWTVTSGSIVSKYEIKINKLNSQTQMETKGITFEVVDPHLLEISNGIVAGMSGSPIIQNNKIIGAVTHVLVDHVTNGYGVYMRWMFDMAQHVFEQYYN